MRIIGYLKLCRRGASCIAAFILAFSLAVSALAAEMPESLIPVGEVVGIRAGAGGAVISQVTEIQTESGTVSPARDGGLLPGDRITALGDTAIESAPQLVEALGKTPEGPVTVTFERAGKTHTTTVTPHRNDKGVFIGVWIKDGISGIGTVTFYDPESNTYGALGHGICDTESGEMFPVCDGEITGATVKDVTKGKPGAPGQLNGVFDLSGTVGQIDKNSVVGIFGFSEVIGNWSLREPVPVASRDEIHTGKATILSACSGSVCEYEIEITRVYPDNDDGRSMMIKITDDELIGVTGGIVQGMSGSPVIQDGKLIGAVTHVLINDPQKGYGVSIQDMLDAAA